MKTLSGWNDRSMRSLFCHAKTTTLPRQSVARVGRDCCSGAVPSVWGNSNATKRRYSARPASLPALARSSVATRHHDGSSKPGSRRQTGPDRWRAMPATGHGPGHSCSNAQCWPYASHSAARQPRRRPDHSSQIAKACGCACRGPAKWSCLTAIWAASYKRATNPACYGWCAGTAWRGSSVG